MRKIHVLLILLLLLSVSATALAVTYDENGNCMHDEHYEITIMHEYRPYDKTQHEDEQITFFECFDCHYSDVLDIKTTLEPHTQIGACSKCGDCPHTNCTTLVEHYYEPYNETMHTDYATEYYSCTNCWYRYATDNWSTLQRHTMRNGVCIRCDYANANYELSEDTVPTEQELLTENRQLGEAAIGCTAIVLHSTRLYPQPDWDSASLAQVAIGTEYVIEDIMSDGQSLWYQVYANEYTAWINARTVAVQVIPQSVEDDLIEKQNIGKMLQITVGSGRVRKEPGIYNEQIGYVAADQRYRILNAAKDRSGYVWYQIEAGDTTGWISSGICNVTGY